MPRFKTADYGLKLIPVDFAQQVLPGSFEFVLCHLVNHELDLSALRARFSNDAGGAPALDPAVLLKIVLLSYSRGLMSSRSMAVTCCVGPVRSAHDEDRTASDSRNLVPRNLKRGETK